MTLKTRTLLVFVMLLGVGGGGALFAGSVLADVFKAISLRTPVIAFQSADAAALTAGIGLLAMAAMVYLPARALAPGRRKPRLSKPRGLDAAALLMLTASIFMILTPFAPMMSRAIVSRAAEGEGYVPCRHRVWPRRQPDRWALPTGAAPEARCPREGTSRG